MHISVERQHDNFVLQIPPKLVGHYERFRIYGWPDSSRFPISLGVVILPIDTNIDELQELLNAHV